VARVLKKGGLAGLVLVSIALVGASSASAYIYWTNIGGNIGRANNDGTGADQNFIIGQTAPEGVAVNGSHIYWANSNSGTSIGRANIDGTGVNRFFISGTQAATGVAIDGSYIYWHHFFGGHSAIGRANLDGSGVNQDFVPGITSNQGSGIAVSGTHIYFTNSFRISRASINGTGLVENFIDPGTGGIVFAPAVGSGFLYWGSTDSNGNGTYGPASRIGRANLDGSDKKSTLVAITGLGLGNPAVFGGRLYFGVFGNTINVRNSIGTADLDGGGANLTLVPRANFPSGVTVDGREAIVFLGSVRCGSPSSCVARIHVPTGGVMALSSKGLKRRAKTFGKASNLKLRLKPRGRTRSRLRDSGKARINVTSTFTPSGGPPSTETDKLTLKLSSKH
jgi:hypothetical protein